MIDDNDRIRPRQATILIVNVLIGVGILTLATETATESGTAAWMVVLLGGLVAAGGVTVVAQLTARFPGMTPIEYAPLLWGRWCGRLLGIMYALYFYSSTAIVLRTFGEMGKTFLLDQTPMFVILVCLLVVAALGSRGGIEPMARLNGLLFFTTLLPSVMIIGLSVPIGEFGNLLPWISEGLPSLLPGTIMTVTAFLGFSVMLFFAPYVRTKGAPTTAYLLGVGIPTVVYTGVVVVSLAVFGVEDLKNEAWPLISLARTVSVPLLQRLEILLVAVWAGVTFTTVNITYAAGQLCLSRSFGLEEPRPFNLPMILIVYLLSRIPGNIASLRTLSDWIAYGGIVLTLAIPVSLLITAWLRGVRGGEEPG